MTTFGFEIGAVIGDNTVIAQPALDGSLYGNMYQLQRPDGTQFYDYLSLSQLNSAAVNIMLNGDNVNSSNPLPVAIVSGGSGGGGSGSSGVLGTTTTPNVSTLTDPTSPTHQVSIRSGGSTSSYAMAIQGIASGVPVPVTNATLPLPTGAATSAKQPALGTAGTAATDVITIQGIAGATAVKVDASATTQPVSAASLPLPTGAATSAKQAAPGTAGSASADVLSIQGIASMVALKVDPSAVTSPISAASLPLPTGAATSAKQAAPGTAGSPSADVITIQGSSTATPIPATITSISLAGTSGSIVANAGSVVYTNNGCSTVNFAITGTWTGTLSYQYSDDNSNWSSAVTSGGTSSTTGNAQGVLATGMHAYTRIVATAWTSGTANITLTPANQGSTTLSGLSGKLVDVSAPSDSFSTSLVGLISTTYTMGYNGTTWDRLKVANVGTDVGSAAKGALTIQGSLSGIQVPVQSGGKTNTIETTPTISTSAYTSGYVLGGKLTFAAATLTALTGILQSIYVRSKTVQTTGLKLYIFTTNPTNSTWTDHAAPAINASDIPFLLGAFPLSAADSGLGTNTIWRADGLGAAFKAAATTIYGILVVTGTPTFTSTTDVTVGITVLQD